MRVELAPEAGRLPGDALDLVRAHRFDRFLFGNPASEFGLFGLRSLSNDHTRFY
jgi:hypothetical protein